jgi:epoxyqueuosine reductase QueG
LAGRDGARTRIARWPVYRQLTGSDPLGSASLQLTACLDVCPAGALFRTEFGTGRDDDRGHSRRVRRDPAG